MGAKGTKTSFAQNAQRRHSRASLKSGGNNQSRHGSTAGPMHTLTDDDYSRIHAKTGYSKNELKKMFDKFVAQAPDGDLRPENFVDLYQSLTSEVPLYLDEDPQFVFDTFDQDQVGSVSFEKFVYGFYLLNKGTLEEKIEYTFNLYDIDRNGYLDIDEIYRAIVKVFSLTQRNKKPDCRAYAEQFLHQLDTTKNGVVSKSEYVQGLLKDQSFRLLLIPFDRT